MQMMSWKYFTRDLYTQMNISGALVAIAIAALHACNAETAGKYADLLSVVVPHPVQCFNGETGLLNKMEVINCASQPCVFTPLSRTEIAPTFTPAYTSVTLAYASIFHPTVGSAITIADVKVPGTFEKNYQYRVLQGISIPSSMAGKSGRISVILADNERVHISRCFNVTVSN